MDLSKNMQVMLEDVCLTRNVSAMAMAMAMAVLRVSSKIFTVCAIAGSTRAMAEVPPLPDAFLDFLKRNDLNPAIYAAAQSLPRYIRVKTQAICELPEIEEELGVKLLSVAWLPNFFSMPPEVQIAGSQAYRKGKIYGMDAASGAAVAALEISRCDHVLDLCAAPGAKLCMVAELLGASGSLTAVDIARPRLAACRTMLQKYGLGNRTRLYLGDGTTFPLLPLRGTRRSPPPTAVDGGSLDVESTKDLSGKDVLHWKSRSQTPIYFGEWRSGRTRKEKRAAKRAKSLGVPLQSGEEGVPELFFYGQDSGVVGMKVAELEQIAQVSKDASNSGYDKVLVDAECTHDGSLKHITKYEQWGWETFERRFLNEDRVASITLLQLQLLSNGFKLLKVGGTLVYSTCSFTRAQNEGVVESFLATHVNAELQEVKIAREWPCKPGGLAHSLRFDPVASNTSGLFVARIRKEAHRPQNNTIVESLICSWDQKV